MNDRLAGIIERVWELNGPPRGNPRRQWLQQRANARTRGIAFTLSFEDWLEWWRSTGKMVERGRHCAEYVMARKADQGAYELGNIECITARRNCVEGNQRRVRRKKHPGEAPSG
jgi:hypothetical protein